MYGADVPADNACVTQAWHATAPEGGLLPPLSMSDESFLTSYPMSALPASQSLAWSGRQPSALQYACINACFRL